MQLRNVRSIGSTAPSPSAQTIRRRWPFCRYFLEHPRQGLVALANLRPVEFPASQRLTQRKEVFLLPSAHQRLANSVGFVLLYLRITQCQQDHRIALPLQNRSNHFESTYSRKIADHIVEFDVHPIQGLLHVLLVMGGLADVVSTQTLIIL